MFDVSTKISIEFNAEKHKTDPSRSLDYQMTYTGCGEDMKIDQFPDEVLYNIGKSVQTAFMLLEKELIRRKSVHQLRSRKERRASSI